MKININVCFKSLNVTLHMYFTMNHVQLRVSSVAKVKCFHLISVNVNLLFPLIIRIYSTDQS